MTLSRTTMNNLEGNRSLEAVLAAGHTVEEGNADDQNDAEEDFLRGLVAEPLQAERPPVYDWQGQAPQYDPQPITSYDDAVRQQQQQDHLADLTRVFDGIEAGAPGPVIRHAADAFRHSSASQDSVRLAFHQDMNARRAAYHDVNGVERYLRSLAGRGLDSPLDGAINHALESTRGHANAGLVAGMIGNDEEVMRRLRQRAGDRSGIPQSDILNARLQAHRQLPVQGPAVDAPPEEIAAGEPRTTS